MRFVVAAILDELDNERFNTWLLHITILPPFEAPSEKVVIDAIKPVINRYLPFNFNVGEFAHYGKRTVQIIIPNPELQSLHDSLLGVVNANNWQLQGRYTGRNYTPHITQQLGRGFGDNSSEITSVALVKSIGLGYKEVVAQFEGYKQ